MSDATSNGRSNRPSLKVEAWSVRRLVAAIEGVHGNEKIFIPSFQRSFVWTKDRQDDLIKSIREEKPIGSLLFYSDGIRNEKNQYQIVDGLQRSTSLLNYQDTVFTSYRSGELDDDFLTGLLTALGLASEESHPDALLTRRTAANAITAWIRKQRSFSRRDGFSAANLLSHVSSATGCQSVSAPDAIQLLENFLDDLERDLAIDEYCIPVVIYSGDKSVLPEIFEKLNTKGVRLSKFDILASSWSDRLVELENLQIIAAVKKRRSKIDEQRVEREHRASTGKTYELYDAACGLGIVYLENYPQLFASKKKVEYLEPPACAFNAVALSFGKRLAVIGDVPESLEKLSSADDYFTSMLDAANEASNTLRGELSGTFRQAKITHAHTELQIASIVASIFRAALGVAPDQYVSSEERARTIRQHYLVDALRNEWSGTGDTKAARAIIQDRYAKAVPKASFLTAAQAWYSEHLQEAKSRTKSEKNFWVDRGTLAFLRAYLAACEIDTAKESGPFDLEVVNPYAGAVAFDGDPAVISNIRILDAHGHVLADPGLTVPAISQSPTRLQMTRHLQQRFDAMLDRIVLAYGFSKY